MESEEEKQERYKKIKRDKAWKRYMEVHNPNFDYERPKAEN